MKHKNVCAALALEQIDFHTNILPGSKPVAKLDEAQVQKLDEALAEKDTSALDQKITDQAATISTLQNIEKEVGNAVKAAYELNGLEYSEGISSAEAIATLSAKCKEYGDSTETHSIPPSTGQDPEKDEEPKYAFVEVLNDMSKYPTYENH